MSIIQCIKNRSLKSLSKVILDKSDLIQICERLEYPDLINILVKNEGVEYFSEVCLEYLKCPSYLKDTSIVLIQQILDGYVVERDNQSRNKEVLEILELILNDAILIKRLKVGNIIKRDSLYREMIRKHVKGIEGVDVNVIITLLVKLNSKDLLGL